MPALYAIFDDNGRARGFYDLDIHPDIPGAAIPITEAEWRELLDHPDTRRWQDGAIVACDPPPPAPVPPELIRIAKGDIWRRATDAEAVTIDAALQGQPVRQRNLFRDAAYLSPADELWPTLRAGFVQAFGEPRTAELLAPSA